MAAWAADHGVGIVLPRGLPDSTNIVLLILGKPGNFDGLRRILRHLDTFRTGPVGGLRIVVHICYRLFLHPCWGRCACVDGF